MYQADYILKLNNDKEIHLLFNTWAFRNYSLRKGVDYEELANGCMLKEDGRPGETLKANNIPGILLIGAEAFCKYNNIPFTYTDLDADGWCDEFHPLTSPELRQVALVFASKLLNISLADLEVNTSGGEEEKKKANGVSRKNPSPGKNSR